MHRQGVTPILWSGISEIYGRRVVYVSSYLIFTVCQAVCAGAQDQITFLVFRILSAVGSSAVLATGAGTLADIYDPEVRGYKIGSYYLFPLLGPSLVCSRRVESSEPDVFTHIVVCCSSRALCSEVRLL